MSILASGQSSRLVIDTDECRYVAKFDPARISETRLRELLLFSPYYFGLTWRVDGQQMLIGFHQSPARLDKSLFADSLELCSSNDPRYRACGSKDVSDANFFTNAEINVERNEQMLTVLSKVDVPAELHIVWEQFRKSLAFYSTIERRRLEYLRTGDIRVLSMRVAELDPLKECAEEMEELQMATTARARYDLSRHEWHNCLNAAWLRKSPPYPRQAWSEFLRAYGITEKFADKDVY